MSFQDRNLTCSDCNSSFTFTRTTNAMSPKKATPTNPSVARAAVPTAVAVVVATVATMSTAYSNGGGYSSREMHPDMRTVRQEHGSPVLPRGTGPFIFSDCFQKQPQTASRRW